MKNDWQPQDYLRFEQERNRPAAELLARIAHRAAQHITDLGCGAGNSTALLREAWRDAHITGVDTSPAMLAAARERVPSCDFVQQDFHDWQSDVPQNVIFANASLQWSSAPDKLFSHLVQQLANGGVLAVQMPDNLQEPSHRMMAAVAAQDEWREYMNEVGSRPNMLKVIDYYDLLVKLGCRVDIWHTIYYHVLPSVEQIAQMFGSTALRPYLNQLNDEQAIEFKQQYIEKLKPHYPTRHDGQILLAVPRLFLVAEKV